MIGKKINQLATELAPVSTDLTIIGDPISGVSKKITLAQLGAIFSGAVSFYTNLAGFPATGDINVIYCAKDTQKLYLWSGSAYVEVFPSQALLDTYQLRSEKGVSNGYASLDSTGKVPISQLPSSIMEYKGTWNAATNTPTLANGTGDTGDVYICNVAGTVNFGAGAITFAVGDYVIYSGTIWQRSSGAVGTVTSVAATITGNAIGITGSPVTTSGTLALAFAGTSSQYINGAGNLTTFPTLTGYVPYTGATANVDLGTFDLTADILTAATGSYTSSGGGNTLEISHTSGSGIALNITKGGNGEGLYINKTSGTGNAATIIGTLNATTLVKSGGTSTQFLKADGSVDSSTYLTTSAAATTYLPMVLSSTANSIEINGQFFDVASAANSYTSGRLIIAPTYGAIGYQNAGVFDGLKILTNGNAEFSNSGITRFFNQVRFDSTLTNGTYTYTLPGATGTLALTSDLTGGTVTSVGLSSATSGVTIGSTPVTTSGTITLAIATASGSQQGLLSSTDWTTFNNKQNALTNPVTGTGTTNYLPKFTGTSTIGNSIVSESGAALNVAGTLTATQGNFTATANTYAGSSLILKAFGGTNPIYLTSVGGLFAISNGGSADHLLLNASGNLGLGVSPSAWGSNVTALELPQSVSLYSWNASAVPQLYLGANHYWDGSTWRYKITGQASTLYYQAVGQHQWFNAPSGTAGNAISFTQAMTLNASGNLSIGNTNDTYKLDVSGTGRFTSFVQSQTNFISESVTNSITVGLSTAENAKYNYLGHGGYWGIKTALTGFSFALDTYNGGTPKNVLTITQAGAATFSSSVTSQSLFQITPTTTTDNALYRATNAGGTAYIGLDSNSGGLVSQYALNLYHSGAYPIIFSTSGVERMRITSGGNVGIGTTSPTNKLDVFGDIGMGGNGVYNWKITTANDPNWGFRVVNPSASQYFTDVIGAWNDGNNRGFRLVSKDGLGERVLMFVNSNGNVGIGTTSPGNFSGVSFSAPITDLVTSLNIRGRAADGVSIINMGGETYRKASIYTSIQDQDPYLAFATGSSGSSSSGFERMRITSGGSLLVGTTSELQSATSKLNIAGDFYNANGVSLKTTNGGSGSQFVGFINESGTLIGSINRVTTTNAVAYNTTSDYRLKEDLKSINGLEIVNKIKVYDYKWKSDNSRMDGVLAHELAEVLPYAVTGIKDGEKMQQVDYSKIVPVLIQSVKELKAELDTLKNK